MPATHIWTNHGTPGSGDGEFGNAANWVVLGDLPAVPGPDDDVVFTAGWGDGGGTNDDCNNMFGEFHSVSLISGYSGTVTLSGTLETYTLTVTSGTIDQPAVPDGYGGTFAPDIDVWLHFAWSGGTINSTENPATVTVAGMYGEAVATISNEVTCGSTLVFDAGTTVEFSASMTVTQERAGIDVMGGSQFSMLGGSLINALNTLADRNTIRVNGAMTKFTTTGSTVSWLGLWIQGGTAEIAPASNLLGIRRSAFYGYVRDATGTPAPGTLGKIVNVLLSTGSLIIDEACTLSLALHGEAWVTGGKLATRVLPEQPTRSALIEAKWLRVSQAGAVQTEVVIGDPSLYPVGVTGLVYSQLLVASAGNVEWKSGTYRPLVKNNGAAPGSSLWTAAGVFQIGYPLNAEGIRPIIAPVCEADLPLPDVGTKYRVINSEENQINRGQVPGFESANANWRVVPWNPAVEDKELQIERTVPPPP